MCPRPRHGTCSSSRDTRRLRWTRSPIAPACPCRPSTTSSERSANCSPPYWIERSPATPPRSPWSSDHGSSPATAASDAIARFATAGTAILARVAPLYDVIRSTSALPEVRRLLDDSRRRRRADQRHLMREFAAAGLLRPGLDVDRAADVVYGLVNEDVFLLLHRRLRLVPEAVHDVADRHLARSARASMTAPSATLEDSVSSVTPKIVREATGRWPGCGGRWRRGGARSSGRRR